jgi:hypothetical protein
MGEQGSSRPDFKFLSKLKQIGNKLEDVAIGFGSTVADGVKVTASTITALPSAITDQRDFEVLRNVHAASKQQDAAAATGRQHRKTYTQQELDAVEARAEEVIGRLYPGYFEQLFDPVPHELEQLGGEAGADEIDAVVERLTLGVEVRVGRASGPGGKRLRAR